MIVISNLTERNIDYVIKLTNLLIINLINSAV